MKARTRTALATLALLAAAAAAVAWGVLGVDRGVDAERAAKEREEKVFALDAKDVRGLTVFAKGDETRLVREGDGWRITAPLEAPADRFAANAIAEKLATLRRRSEVAPPPGGDLTRYGLASPKVRVEATLEGGRGESLAVGDESAFDGAAFVRPTSGAVLAVSGDVRWTLERGTFDLREKRIVRFERDEVAAIDGGGWRVERKGDGWALPSGPADATKVSAVLTALETLRATRFVEAAALGGARPSRTVVLTGDGGKELARLEVGKVERDEALVRAGSIVAAVPKGALEAIPRSAAELAPPPPAPPADAAAPPAAPAPGARAAGGDGAPGDNPVDPARKSP